MLDRIQRFEVSGLLLKSDTGTEEFLTAVQAVIDGRKYFSKTVRAAMAAARSSPLHYTKVLSPR